MTKSPQRSAQLRTSHDHARRMEEIRSAGGWIPWACTGVAVTWWAGAGAYVVGKIGIDGLLALPAAELGGGLAMAAAPGFALIMAGFMGRESVRSSHANSLVMAAAQDLLSPAERFTGEIDSLGAAIAKQSQTINDTLNEAEARIQVLKDDIKDSSNAVLKAAEVVRADADALTSKLSRERQELISLSEDMKKRGEAMHNAIPLHAEKLVRAASAAHDDIRKAGASLDERLSNVEETGKALSGRVAQLDQMAGESRKRAQSLVNALVSLNEQLQNSSKTVDNAAKAGDMAVEASRNTADAIRSAMDSALDGARESADVLSHQAEQAKRDADIAIERLKQAAQQAEVSVKSAMQSAHEQADATEQRMDKMSEHMFQAATRATSAAEAGLERARARIERASSLLNGALDEPQSRTAQPAAPAQPVVTPTQAPPPPQQPVVRSPARPSHEGLATPLRSEEDLFDADEVKKTPPAQSLEPFDPLEETSRAPQSKPTASANAPSQRASEPVDSRPPAESSGDVSWSELLSGIEGNASAQDTALAFVDQLDRAGIRLKRAIRSGDLRRIAAATARGERQRRRATKQAAPGELLQIQRLLKQDDDLKIAAESYLSIEEPEALRFLQGAERVREDAGPRLAAYLLLDAALS